MLIVWRYHLVHPTWRCCNRIPSVQMSEIAATTRATNDWTQAHQASIQVSGSIRVHQVLGSIRVHQVSIQVSIPARVKAWMSHQVILEWHCQGQVRQMACHHEERIYQIEPNLPPSNQHEENLPTTKMAATLPKRSTQSCHNLRHLPHRPLPT